MELPDCDADGFRLASDSPRAVEAAAAAAAAAAKGKQASSSSSLRPSLDHVSPGAASVFARHGWNIPTITAMAGSLAGASSHSTLGSNSARSLASSSIAHASDYSASNTSGSAAATPLARRSVHLPSHHLDTIFSIDIDDSILDRQQQQGAGAEQQEPVYQLDTQASLPAIPHLSASSLRYRQVGSDDGHSPAQHSSPLESPCGHSSPNSARARHMRLTVRSPVASSSSSSHGSSQKQQQPAGWSLASEIMGSRPPPCSALFEPQRQRVLLPASLVRQYGYYPLVLVQLPMYNEEAHCEVVIERACNMVWPHHRVIIQVCLRHTVMPSVSYVACCLEKPCCRVNTGWHWQQQWCCWQQCPDRGWWPSANKPLKEPMSACTLALPCCCCCAGVRRLNA